MMARDIINLQIINRVIVFCFIKNALNVRIEIW